MECLQNSSVQVKNLSVDFKTSHGLVHAVKDVNIQISKGKIHALVGESGSGKSVTSLAIMNLLANNGKVTGGEILLGEKDLLKMSRKERNKYMGNTFGMIFQDPTASLDPLFTVGDLMTEGLIEKGKMTKKEARELAIESLKAVNLANPEYLMSKRPFELSGGMCQRVMIAIVMSMRPEFLIADEPTTALDVTVQKQILEQIYEICHEKNIGILFITHDLGVVAEIADEVSIMQDGVIVESGTVEEIFYHAKHEYTKRLLDAVL
ncbi:MAG: ABC transporter ATP-binding protein [Eubacteriales bacterium]|nr:ABC transporter ATP-binding protein [Eubacteriales bacterium]